jgi:hypothetical protein
MEVTTEKNNGAAGAIRVCRKPGCDTPLGPTNRSGNCSAHCHYGKPKPGRSAGKGQAITRSNGANGHAAENAGATAILELAGDLREDRLDHLILGMPLASKARIATLFFRGEI